MTAPTSRRRLFVPPLPDAAIDIAARGFRPGEADVRAVLDARARSFVTGYRLQRRPGRPIHDELAEVPADNRGFAYEGAALAAAMADVALPRATLRDRPGHLQTLLNGAGDGYVHLSHVGAGWLGAVLPWRTVLRRLPLDPLLRWLALDGAGFARGFFGGRRYISRLAARPDRRDPVQAVACQGAGRSLWFVENADVGAIAAQIARFPARLRGELWAGVGLAASYAGGRDRAGLAGLVTHSGADRVALAQGASFAAEARRCAGHIPLFTCTAVEVLTGVPAITAADWARDTAGPARRTGSGIEAYRLWQVKIRRRAGAVVL